MFSHTQNPPHKQRQAAAGSLARSTLAACRHEPLTESARRSPWLPPTAPVPLPRFACFVSGSIEAIRHASISRRGSLCSPMRRSCWHGCANAIRPAASAHFGAGSIERTRRSMSRMGSMGEPTRHVCRHGFANGVSRAPSARFWCGALYAKHPHDVTCAGAGCRERRCLFCLRGPAVCLRGCRKSILRRRPLPASAAVRAVRLLPAANAFRPAHRLPRRLEVVGHG